MLHERIYLDPSDERVYIDTYVANDKTITRDAMLVIPGGGYHGVATVREGEPVALAYFAKGFNAFVLNYRVSGYAEQPEADAYPSQLIDASRAILHIKQNAEKYGIDPERVFAMGFSAGGHLAGSLAVLHSEPEVIAALGCAPGENRPRACVLSYPVVTAMANTHEGSFAHLMRKPFAEISEADRRRLSLEEQVDEHSAPLFIWHTAEDKAVPPIGSLLLAAKYIERSIPVSLHVYPYGPHGIALANLFTSGGNPNFVQPEAQGWLDTSVEWLNTLK